MYTTPRALAVAGRGTAQACEAWEGIGAQFRGATTHNSTQNLLSRVSPWNAKRLEMGRNG